MKLLFYLISLYINYRTAFEMRVLRFRIDYHRTCTLKDYEAFFGLRMFVNLF